MDCQDGIEMYRKKTIISLIIGSFAFSLHPFIEFFILCYKANWRCILFGQIFEMKREFTDGYMPACVILLLSLLFSSTVGFYHIVSYSKRKPIFSTPFERRLQIVCFILSLLSILIFKAGHLSLCNSLDFTPICNAETIYNIEFKYFSPKYLDISLFPDQFLRMTISMCFHIACVFTLTVIMVHNQSSQRKYKTHFNT